MGDTKVNLLNRKQLLYLPKKENMTKDFLKTISDRNVSIQEITDFLIRNYSIFDLATELATYMLKERERPTAKIPVTEQEFQQICNLFRVKGVRADGTEERRGRKRLDSDLK